MSAHPGQPNGDDPVQRSLPWRVALPLSDVAGILGIDSNQVRALLAEGVIQGGIVEGWVLIPYGDLAESSGRNAFHTKLFREWGSALERDAEQASTRKSSGDECASDGCLTRGRRSRPRRRA